MFLGMLEYRIGKRREVEVIAEKLLGRDGFEDLDKGTLGAEGQIEREPFLRAAQIFLREEGIREGNPAERENSVESRVST